VLRDSRRSLNNLFSTFTHYRRKDGNREWPANELHTNDTDETIWSGASHGRRARTTWVITDRRRRCSIVHSPCVTTSARSRPLRAGTARLINERIAWKCGAPRRTRRGLACRLERNDTPRVPLYLSLPASLSPRTQINRGGMIIPVISVGRTGKSARLPDDSERAAPGASAWRTAGERTAKIARNSRGWKKLGAHTRTPPGRARYVWLCAWVRTRCVSTAW